MATIYDGNGNVVTVSDMDEYAIPITIIGLPKVYITSSTAYSNLTKTDASQGTISFIDGKEKFSLQCTIKLQGEGSLLKAKKNLNIRLFANDDTYKTKQKIKFGSWYATNKFHLKANETDYSMCRNSVGTRIAYDLMGRNLPDGAMGYIDSFPIIVYYNDEWLGCYTWNLTQDGTLFNFKKNKETSGKNLAYRINNGSQFTDPNSWEYRGDEDETDGMRSVLSDMLASLDADNLTKEMVSAHFNVDSLVNYLICAEIFNASDSLGNNYTIATWDGNTWYFTFYDLDSSFGTTLGGNGTSWTGSIIQNPSATSDFYRFNKFMVNCVPLYADELKAVYAKFRAYYDLPTFVYKRFWDFQSKWGLQNLTEENTKWASDKPAKIDIGMINAFMTARINSLDTIYEYTPS